MGPVKQNPIQKVSMNFHEILATGTWNWPWWSPPSSDVSNNISLSLNC